MSPRKEWQDIASAPADILKEWDHALEANEVEFTPADASLTYWFRGLLNWLKLPPGVETSRRTQVYDPVRMASDIEELKAWRDGEGCGSKSHVDALDELIRSEQRLRQELELRLTGLEIAIREWAIDREINKPIHGQEERTKRLDDALHRARAKAATDEHIRRFVELSASEPAATFGQVNEAIAAEKRRTRGIGAFCGSSREQGPRDDNGVLLEERLEELERRIGRLYMQLDGVGDYDPPRTIRVLQESAKGEDLRLNAALTSIGRLQTKTDNIADWVSSVDHKLRKLRRKWRKWKRGD